MIGTVIGNYKIISKIGEGGMGSVFLAEHTKLSRKVAIKNLHDVLVKNEEIRKRFQNEAQAMAKLQHENIVNLLDFEENEHGLFLIMEYVDGAPLDELLKANSIPADQSLEIVKSILEGLKYAHKKDIVHRDIKPSNILINSEDMSPKILDFGIAKMLGTDNSMTKTGTQMGTVYFMSPEQVKGEKVDQRSDIYAVGVTLFQLINGSNPYANLSTEYEVYNKIVSEELPDLTSKGVAQGVVDIISKATEKNVDNRFQSCQEMIDAISDFLAGRKSKITPKPKTGVKGAPNGGTGGKKVLWILLILLFLGGIGVTGYYLNEEGKFEEWFGKEKSDEDEDDDDASSEADPYESQESTEDLENEYTLCECLILAYNNGGSQNNLSNVIENDSRCNWLSNIRNGQQLVDDNYNSCTFYMDHFGITPSWENNDELADSVSTDYTVYDPEGIVNKWVYSIANKGVGRYNGFLLCEINRSPFNDWSYYNSGDSYGYTNDVYIKSTTCLDYDYQNTLSSGGSVRVNVEYLAYSSVHSNLDVNQTMTVSTDGSGELKIFAVETISAVPF